MGKLVKQLREQTGCPIQQCKQALQESNMDLEAAKEYLKEKGLSRAQKYQTKETREGLVGLRISEDSKNAAMLELNCQTDFVARTESFLNYSSAFLNSLLKENKGKQGFEYTQAGNEQEISEYLKNHSLNEQIIPQADASASISETHQYLISHLQENINLRRFSFLAANQGIFGAYCHNSISSGLGQKQCLVELELENDKNLNEEQIKKIRKLADDIALQILGNKPEYLKKSDIPEEILEKEREIVKTSFGDKLEGKPEKVQKNMVEGKMKKFYEDRVLMSQSFIFDDADEGDARSMEQYIKEIEKSIGTKINIKQFQNWSCEQ
ncbi:UBA-like protein [Pseudocohnilembus persalinus]|uniref:Elongation factor Ts, mitochondrial n=1 Tax=Pseudocohnilembus persalinus TaxID=266149 RepID=A0A0V0QXB1_PSEPJ|nr:UBA-like protein [Pseudocohnilembus persalinus]|eukprot:KRX06882.1 UBA-like protein [Pseudocohnilembus persalinus]